MDLKTFFKNRFFRKNEVTGNTLTQQAALPKILPNKSANYIVETLQQRSCLSNNILKIS